MAASPMIKKSYTTGVRCFNRYGFAVASISCDGAAENRRLAKLLCTVAAREMISAELLYAAAWAAVRATQRSGSGLAAVEAEIEEAKAIAAALGDVLIGWRWRGRVIVVVADMPHVVKKVSGRGVGA